MSDYFKYGFKSNIVHNDCVDRLHKWEAIKLQATCQFILTQGTCFLKIKLLLKSVY